MIKYNDIRKLFLDYMEKNGHKIVPSASLIPEDPTLMFTVAGMVPWKEIFLGHRDAPAARVADVQKCIRAGGKHNDLEDVGFDGRHHTFFEMLGNWSFGDYFKDGAIEMSWDLLTHVMGIDPARLVVTTHISDDEATQIWKKITGKDAIRLDKSNWWSAGDTGPCGPCTEIFYDYGSSVAGGLPGTRDEDGGRYVEIWNDVFMQYNRDENGVLSDLPHKNVDTGAGLERWAAMLDGVTDNYETDVFANLINATESVVGVKKTPENIHSFKIITDHLRAVGFAIADGVVPSNTERGYVIRRILRRAMRHGQVLGHRGALLSALYPALVETMGDAYPELLRESERVIAAIQKEERAFDTMLHDGLKLLEKSVSGSTTDGVFAGDIAFKLYDTYGFPLDLTQSILAERGIAVDVDGFNASMREQKERSKASGTFKGGLADSGEQTAKLHTATHLLHGALRRVLGDTVFQRGSNITPERLRFDFNFDRKLTPDELAAVEKIVNDAINEKIPVVCEHMTPAAAHANGAVGIFDDKYGDDVSVYTIAGYDSEICGGPHAKNTGDLKSFKITKEEGVAAGIRRIKAVIG